MTRPWHYTRCGFLEKYLFNVQYIVVISEISWTKLWKGVGPLIIIFKKKWEIVRLLFLCHFRIHFVVCNKCILILHLYCLSFDLRVSFPFTHKTWIYRPINFSWKANNRLPPHSIVIYYSWKRGVYANFRFFFRRNSWNGNSNRFCYLLHISLYPKKTLSSFTDLMVK
jgi:hypothetical protein